MKRVTMRFSGRFVFAEPKTSGDGRGSVKVLAPNMPFGDARVPPHQVFMSVSRSIVNPRHTTASPSHKVMSGDLPATAEQWIWNLSAAHVKVCVTGGFSFEGDSRALLPDLAALAASSGGANTTLNRVSLNASSQGPVMAVIALEAGRAIAKSTFGKLYNFAINENRNTLLYPEPVNRADLVKVRLDLPVDHDLVTIEIMTLSAGIGGTVETTRQVVLKALPGKDDAALETDGPENDGAVIDFSNLCGSLPRFSPFDDEFANYYDLLENAPALPGRFIPLELAKGGGGGDCDLLSRMLYGK